MKLDFIVLITFLILQHGYSLDYDIIVRFCQSKNLMAARVFTCDNKKERIETVKKLGSMGLSIIVYDMNNLNISLNTKFRGEFYLASILDGDCLILQQWIYKFQESDFNDNKYWLITTTKPLKKSIKILQKAPMNVNSNVHLAIYNDFNWRIYDIYNQAYNHNGEIKINFLGYYDDKIGYNFTTQQSKYWLRKNMTGVKFKSAVVVPDYKWGLDEYLTSEEHRQEHSMHRFQSVTVRYCRDMFNFSLSIHRTDSWGYLQSSGHFDGLVGLLARREIDIGASPLLFKFDRLPFVDYSFGNWILRSAFIFRHPKIRSASYVIFLRPLSNTVWICIVIFMVLITFALKLVFSRERKLLGAKTHDEVDSSWSFLILFTLGAFCQQGATCYPKLISSRTLSVFVFFFCILIYQFYSASIVSYLLMDPPRVINNLKDLLESNLKPGIEDILIDRNYFVQTTDPIAIQLFNTKIKGDTNDSGFYEPNEGLKLVKQGGFAYHVETSTAYPIIANTFTNQEICELEEVQLYRTQPMYTNLQKNSPFREMINYCMLRIVEDGEMFRLRKYWNIQRPACIESAKKITIHVGIHEFSCGLIVLSYGVLFAIFFFGAEVIIYRQKNKKGDKEKEKFLRTKESALKPFVN